MDLSKGKRPQGGNMVLRNEAISDMMNGIKELLESNLKGLITTVRRHQRRPRGT